MADTTIRGLSAGTLAIDTAFVGQNTGTGTLAEKFDFSAVGGLILASNTLTTANLTATVGTLHQLTIAGLTADRDFILPDTAAVGETIGLYIVDGDASFEVNIKTAATGSLLNGTDHSSTEWSKVFIAGETMLFRCVNGGGAGDTDWIIQPGGDGRTPCVASMYLAADDLDGMPVDDTNYQVPLDTSLHDNFSGVITAQEHILIRRTGTYACAGMWVNSDSFSTTGLIRTEIYVNNAGTVKAALWDHHSADAYNGKPVSRIVELTAADTLELWSRAAGITNQGYRAASNGCYLECREIFT